MLSPLTPSRLMAMLAFSMLFMGTGCPPPPCCTTDADCADLPTVGCERGDEDCYQPVCAESVCAYTCNVDTDCNLDEICLRGDDGKGACVKPGGYPAGECPAPVPPVTIERCDDDRFEDNDNVAEPSLLTPGRYDASLCGEDEDWFQFDTGTGRGRFSIDVLDGRDLLVTSFASDGTQTVVQVAQGERLISASQGPGPVLFNISKATSDDDDTPLDYAVEIERLGNDCTDAYEPNDTQSTGARDFGLAAQGQICGPDDVDWFVVPRPAFSDIFISLTFTHADGDIDARLYSPSGEVVAQSTSADDDEQLVFFTGPQDGDYALEVFGFDGQENRYTLFLNDPGNMTCGDGNLDPGEQCDDGNLVGGDGCTPFCTEEGTCGNGAVEFPEECDDGNLAAGDGCSPSCTLEPGCGNGIVDAGEECDDGNLVAGDGCDSTCRIEIPPTCGDGDLDPGEQCDDGNNVNGDGCAADCAIEVPCGNGVLDAGEECDDGNLTGGDGCSVLCEVEIPAGWTCPAAFYNHQSCDCGCGVIDIDCSSASASVCAINNCPAGFDPRPDENFLCNNDQCGNGVAEVGEECDDGNTLNGDGCNANCQLEGGVCGNGFLEVGEDCDDGNTQNGDGCSSTCAVEAPPGWTCPDAQYIDGVCDCGCGIFDLDCPTLSSAVCERSACAPGFVPAAMNNPICEMPMAVCGNGQLEVGEQCDDGNINDGDGCDATCNIEPPVCGNGILEAGEQCDDGNTQNLDGCSASCVLEDIVPPDWICFETWYGDGICDCGCNAQDIDCESLDPDACGFINCDGGSTLPDDNRFCAEVGCGNGILEPGEGCDDGNNIPGDGCSATCDVETACGNGIVEFPEQCDDGNLNPGDGCAPDCTIESDCGNGIVEFPEQCDDGNLVDGDGCSAFCTLELAECGNALQEPGEQCDDGNLVDGDGCSSFCQLEIPLGWTCPFFFFGDGVCDCGCGGLDEDCPDLSRDVCQFNNCPGGVEPVFDNNAQCEIDTCGDGLLQPPEECDDGNLEPGDGCNGSCQLEPACGNGTVEPGEQCDDGNLEPGDGCSPFCLLESACGNGILDPGEQCDDGNLTAGDGCSPVCVIELPECGDGTLQFPEDCDDGNLIDGDGCAADCRWEIPGAWVCPTAFYGSDNSCDCGCGALDPDCESALAAVCDFDSCPGGTDPIVDANFLCDLESCGNGTIEPPEECDDGNTTGGDGCNGNCELEPVCGNGIVDFTEECDDGNTQDGDGCDAECRDEIPDDWTCPNGFFGDNFCDCGCGAFDVLDCESPSADVCQFNACDDPTTPNPTMNWICDFPSCQDDLSEDNDTPADATFLGESFTNADLCPDDPDVYAFDIDAGFIGTVTLEYDAPPSMTLEVFDESGNDFGISNDGDGDEEIVFTAPQTSTVFARVTGDAIGPFDARRYQIQVQIDEPECVPDAFEPNDDPFGPSPIGLPTFIDATLCTGDLDFFRFFPLGQEEVLTLIEAEAAAGLTVTLVDEAALQLIATVNAPGEQLVNLPPGIASVLVVVSGNAETPYSLFLE